MQVHEHKLPNGLINLLQSGALPTDRTNSQELNPILGKEAAHQLSSEGDRIVLMSPPFHTISDEVVDGNAFWTHEVTNPGEIEYAKAVIIADFGIGSDSPIILYYRNPDSPVVMYLQWIGDGDNIRHQWVETHSSFNQFSAAVGLEQMRA